jgi:DNA invertase Pin-like site-specific DNA recombinase
MTTKSHTRSKAPLGIYVRVSDVGGRDGERFISPKVQREQAERYALSRKRTTADVFEDLDVSGATPLDERPALSKALAKVEEGTLGGIVVATQDRAARDLSLLRELRARVKAAGGVLLAADNPSLEDEDIEGLAALPTDIRALVDEAYRGEARKRWRTARSEAIGRGVHVGHTPAGYGKGEDGRLTPDERAPLVRGLFERKIEGASLSKCAAYGDKHFPRPNGKHWSRMGIKKLISNRVYLGEVRSGEFVNLSAHEPIVSEDLYLAANRAGVFHPHTGKLSGQAMLSGLVRCAGCGFKMQVGRQWSSGKGTERATYYCRSHSSDGRCPSPVTIRVDTLDRNIEDRLLDYFESPGPLGDAVAASGRKAGAEASVVEAQDVLDKLLSNTRLIAALGEDEYTGAVENAKRDLEIAKADLAEIREQASIIDGLTDGQELTRESFRSLDVASKRRIVASLLDRVVVRSGKKSLGWSQIVWRGNVTLDAPDGYFYAPEEPEVEEAATV